MGFVTVGVVTLLTGSVVYKQINNYQENKHRKKLFEYFTPEKRVEKEKSTLIKIKDALVLTISSEANRRKIRDEQMIEIAGGEQEVEEAEKAVNRRLAVGTANLVVAGVSLLYPPLILLTVPGIIYIESMFFQLAYKAIVVERRLSSYLLDVILETGMLLGQYFYISALGSWLDIVGLKLLRQTENNSKKSLSNLFREQPRFVWLLVDDVEVQIPFSQLQVGDIVVIKAGQMIPIDGLITNGMASVDQHKLTGESQPVEKGEGDQVLASTVVLAGRICIRTENTGQETVAMQIGRVLNETADYKNSIQSRGEEIADKLTLPILGLSILCLPLGLSSALAVLTNKFGYKMRVFAPVTVLSYLDIASRNGILIKDGRSLELLSGIDTVVFDKTGTLTLEQPTVGKIHTFNEIDEDQILKYAAMAEYGQTHPIAKAILAAADASHLEGIQVEDTRYEVGYGIQVTLPNKIIRVGSSQFMTMSGVTIPSEMARVQEDCHKEGHSLVMVAFDEELVGAIELHATIRPEAKQLIDDLHQRGISTVIISGDHEPPTKKLADMLGIEGYFANTLPQQKAELIEKLQDEGKSVCFVGDGINDSIALKKAHVSVSLRGATTIATDTAQIVLMDGTLNQFGSLFSIVDEFEDNMKINLLLSTAPSVVLIGGVLFLHWGIGAAIVMAQTVLIAGITNAISPRWKHKKLDESDTMTSPSFPKKGNSPASLQA